MDASFKVKEDAAITTPLNDLQSNYDQVLHRSKDDLDQRNNLVSFTMEDFEGYTRSKKAV